MTELPVIIEVAVNGAATRERNPHVPKSPAEVAADAAACLKAGATIIHSHLEDLTTPPEAAAGQYAEAYRRIVAEFPQAILYPTAIVAKGHIEHVAHLPALAEQNLADMGAFDPGTMNYALGVENGLPKQDFPWLNSYSIIRTVFARLCELGLGASMGMYDPSFARAVIAWHRAGKLPAGSFVKFYFGGRYDFLTGEEGAVGFGLPPTAKALDAYLEMFEGTNLPWAVALLGGDVTQSGMTRLSLERGGHVRIGLEDYCGKDTPRNIELVEHVVEVSRALGRPVATPEQARKILGLPPRRI